MSLQPNQIILCFWRSNLTKISNITPTRYGVTVSTRIPLSTGTSVLISSGAIYTRRRIFTRGATAS